jgi:hypothetical protein
MEAGRRVHAEFRLSAIKGGPCGILHPSWVCCCLARPWRPGPRLRNRTGLVTVSDREKSAHWIKSLTTFGALVRAALPMSKGQISGLRANRVIV